MKLDTQFEKKTVPGQSCKVNAKVQLQSFHKIHITSSICKFTCTTSMCKFTCKSLKFVNSYHSLYHGNSERLTNRNSSWLFHRVSNPSLELRLRHESQVVERQICHWARPSTADDPLLNGSPLVDESIRRLDRVSHHVLGDGADKVVRHIVDRVTAAGVEQTVHWPDVEGLVVRVIRVLIKNSPSTSRECVGECALLN